MCIGVHKCACVLVCEGRGFRERERETGWEKGDIERVNITGGLAMRACVCGLLGGEDNGD